MKTMSVKDLHHELHLYYCAGGHTRAAQAKAMLTEAGFRFEGVAIYWPDGEKLSHDDAGNVIYRDWTKRTPPPAPGYLDELRTFAEKVVVDQAVRLGTPEAIRRAGEIELKANNLAVAVLQNWPLISAVPELLAALKEEHADRVFRVNAGPDVEAMMRLHKREEPGCPSCAAIAKAEAI